MFFDKQKLQTIFSKKDFNRGMDYYRRKQVTNIQVSSSVKGNRITCTVQGHMTYQISMLVQENGTSIYCSCPRFKEKRICKHIAAAMLACADMNQDDIPVSSDRWARQMLQSYMAKTKQPQKASGKPARLVPRIYTSDAWGEYPSFSFQVGFERLYVVRDIKKFVDSIIQRDTVSYGKNLTLCHDPKQFDPLSQEIIEILLDQFKNGRAVGSPSYLDDYYEDMLFSGSRQKNMITLTGSSFDRLFDLFQDQSMEEGDLKSTIAFSTGDPEVTLSLVRQGRGANLSLQVENGSWSFFGSTRNLYAMGPDCVLHCSPKFQENVYPMLQTGVTDMRLSLDDLPAFCGCVLPEVQSLIEIQDPAQLLQEYLPDDCTPCFRFDMDGDTLTLRLEYCYNNDITFSCFETPKKPVKRDVRTEQAAKNFAEQYFAEQDGKLYRLTGDDAIYTFLTEQMEKFHDIGDVFVTSRLRDKRIQPSRSAVGLSVSNGLLMLDFDTGGFPPAELEALYQSLLKRRRYYRLSDGRYLPLDGSSCETLAEMGHMLQLSAKDLSKGKVQLPAFRALYLDELLSGNNNVQVRRNRQFREMVRDFKSVPEGGFALPESLENTLRPYQKVGFQWLKTLEHYSFGGILADEMGLGKTLQVIAYLAALDPEQQDGPSLVICPASLILNWADEMDKFAPDLSYELIMGAAANRARLISSGGDKNVWVTSYELLRQDVEQYADLHFTCCILDEGQHIKNQSTLASKAVKRINCRQRFVLTGTPIENRLSELWNLFDFLMPGYLFSHRGFVEKLEKPAVKSGDQEAMAQLRRMVQPFLLRRMKKDVLKELPPKTEFVRRISLSEEERKVYFAASSAALQSLSAAGDNNKMAVLAALTQLRQICCAPELCFENYEGPSSKLDACMELCAGMVENGHQILLFSQFTSMLDRIRSRLDELNISHFTLQGSTPKEKRAQLVKSFNNGGASVFLISLKAGGTGLNLTAADVVIHYDPWWNLAAQDQATDRAHRMGQQARVQVYKLIAEDTIEEKILQLQSKKAALMDAVTEGTEGGIANMSREELLDLFR